jgi:hypothetical protein
MSQSTFNIIFIVVMVILIIFVFFPYQRFNIAIKYATIIKIIIGAVAIGMSVANYLLH